MEPDSICDLCGKAIFGEEGIDHEQHGLICDDCSCAVADEEYETDG